MDKVWCSIFQHIYYSASINEEEHIHQMRWRKYSTLWIRIKLEIPGRCLYVYIFICKWVWVCLYPCALHHVWLSQYVVHTSVGRYTTVCYSHIREDARRCYIFIRFYPKTFASRTHSLSTCTFYIDIYIYTILLYIYIVHV